MKYVFYFDEAFHDRKIVISERGSINTLREEAIDDYVGVFWGCKRECLNGYVQQLTDFEMKYRKSFGLAEDKELKSEIIGKKNYQYGLRSFNKNAQSFYTDLFEMLSRWNIILQIRLSDLLSGFVGRMIYALKHDETAQEKVLKDYREIDLEDIKKKRLLNPKWFELKESHFKMYKLIYEVLIVQHEH
ncbi:MAG: hypothetical protein PUB32_04745 [Clostridiales bacterium]|nr:hypothetical protein [Clostridiales bacterium]